MSLDGFIFDEDKSKARLAQLEALDEKRVNVKENLRVYHSIIKI